MGQSVEVAAVHDIGNRMGFKVNQIGPVHPTVEGGYQAALALEGGDTTAIITYNDLIAVGIVLRFTADGVNLHLRLPADQVEPLKNRLRDATRDRVRIESRIEPGPSND